MYINECLVKYKVKLYRRHRKMKISLNTYNMGVINIQERLKLTTSYNRKSTTLNRNYNLNEKA